MFGGMADTHGFTFIPILSHPKSFGTLRLRSRNPMEFPVLDPRYLSHPDDVSTMVEGLFVCTCVHREKHFVSGKYDNYTEKIRETVVRDLFTFFKYIFTVISSVHQVHCPDIALYFIKPVAQRYCTGARPHHTDAVLVPVHNRDH